jgi:hypothetical protein
MLLYESLLYSHIHKRFIPCDFESTITLSHFIADAGAFVALDYHVLTNPNLKTLVFTRISRRCSGSISIRRAARSWIITAE